MSEITREHVLQVLRPLWLTKCETAGALRGRIELVLSWAGAMGYREGDNPARWRGGLDHVLPSKAKVRPVVHHPALVFRDLPAFMGELRAREAIAARCLEFLILTAVRSAEAIGAKWDEIDLDGSYVGYSARAYEDFQGISRSAFVGRRSFVERASARWRARLLSARRHAVNDGDAGPAHEDGATRFYDPWV